LHPIGFSSATYDPVFEEWMLLGDEAGRSLLWQKLAEQAHGRVRLTGLRRSRPGQGAEEAEQFLRNAGYVTAQQAWPANPRLDLPADWDTLIAAVSRNLRSQYRRHRRQLERHGALTLRTLKGNEAQPFLESFLRMEAAGWKGRAGTAILSSSGDANPYRTFFRTAARKGGFVFSSLSWQGRQSRLMRAAFFATASSCSRPRMTSG
jgi:predicted N-acyltransferase